MMYKRILLLLLILLPGTMTPAQQPHKKKKQLECQINPSAGINIPLTRLLTGYTTDQLFTYDDHSYYWQFISVTLFFDRHWGVELNIRGNNAPRLSRRAEAYSRAVKNEYGDRYYADPATGASYPDNKFPGGAFQSGYLGVVYRLQADRFYFHPQLAIGVTSFYTDWGSAYLKEKESNQYLSLSYQQARKPRDHFSLAAAAGAGYRLNKWLALHADLMVSGFRTRIAFDKVLTDLHTQTVLSEEIIPYKKNLFTLSPGLGLRFAIGVD